MSVVRIHSEQDITPDWQFENEIAETLGFECHPDPKRGAGWCSFRQGDVRVWRSQDWIRARLIDGHFRFHSKHATLEDALKGINGAEFGPDTNPRKYALCTRPRTAHV